MAMARAGIIRFRREPWQAETIPGVKGDPQNTDLWRYLGQL